MPGTRALSLHVSRRREFYAIHLRSSLREGPRLLLGPQALLDEGVGGIPGRLGGFGRAGHVPARAVDGAHARSVGTHEELQRLHLDPPSLRPGLRVSQRLRRERHALARNLRRGDELRGAHDLQSRARVRVSHEHGGNRRRRPELVRRSGRTGRRTGGTVEGAVCVIRRVSKLRPRRLQHVELDPVLVRARLSLAPRGTVRGNLLVHQPIRRLVRGGGGVLSRRRPRLGRGARSLRPARRAGAPPASTGPAGEEPVVDQGAEELNFDASGVRFLRRGSSEFGCRLDSLLGDDGRRRGGSLRDLRAVAGAGVVEPRAHRMGFRVTHR